MILTEKTNRPFVKRNYQIPLVDFRQIFFLSFPFLKEKEKWDTNFHEIEYS
jgi:hypothetical protein